MKTNKFDMLVLAMVVITLLTVPTQWTVSDVGIEPAAIMMALTALVWGVGVLVRRQLGTLRWPPLAAWVFLGLCVPSLAWTANFSRGLVELLQFIAYFFVAYMVFVNTLVTPRAKKAALVALAAGLLANVAYAFRMYVTTLNVQHLPVDVAGLLGNRNVFGVYLCLLVPLAGAVALYSRPAWTRIIGAVLALISLGVVLAGGPYLGILVGLGGLVGCWRFRYLPVYIAFALTFTLFALPAMRHDNLRIMSESVFMYDEAVSPSDHPVQVRYLEWQQALKSLDPEQPPYVTKGDYYQRVLLGHGIGMYERNVARFRGALPYPDANVIEPDSQNQYVVLAITSGFPAALAFVWLLATYGYGACRTMLAGREPMDRAIAAGVIASMIAVAIAANWALVIVRGTGFIIAALAAMSAQQSKIEQK